MNSAFKPLLAVFAMVLVMVGFSCWSRSGGGHDDADYGGMPWRKTLAEAQRESAERGRPVVAYFTASWCPPCQQMKVQTWPDARVQAAMKDFVPVRIDVDENPDVAQQYGVESIPRQGSTFWFTLPAQVQLAL